MLRRRILGIGMAAVICATTLGILNPSHAHAASIHTEECLTSGTWTFSPALNSNPGGFGTVTVSYAGYCQDPINETSRNVSGSEMFYYNGGCEFATITPTSGTGSGVLIGGTVSSGVFGSSTQLNYSESVLTNPWPAVCDEATAAFSDAVTVEYYY
jgi:hypothetical protein